ncbi:ABC transporter ATP-binding protein [Oceanicaulis alexandrii]|uniref:ABC transporter ATP-binding protein n=1 Tax=Oceanicaulis alexandrii TaxID=153233 RepID=UPI0035D0AD4F
MTSSSDIAPVLQASALTRRYGRKTALDAVDMSVSGAGVLALLGPNGAGKTTFVQTALGLVRPSSGALHVFGAKPGDRAIKTRIGVMMQDTDLAHTLTGRELLELFASYYPNPANLDALIERCALTDFIKRRYGQLSGGQKRRIQFALSLVGQPDLLFLDEPTTGLDIEARRALWAIVRDVAAQGTLVVLTTHYLEEADALADRVVVLQSGRIIADDTADGLRTRMGGAVISCVTSLSDEALNALPGLIAMTRSGRKVRVQVSDSVAFLKALLNADPALSDLSVAQPTLEDAFEALTGQSEPEGA